jgi:hypothetical protein
MADDNATPGRESGLLVYANLHTHSSYSTNVPPKTFGQAPDHVGAEDPVDLLRHAFSPVQLNCVAITDHGEEITGDKWNQLAWDCPRAPSGLTAIRGCEWTDATPNHVNVFGSSDWVMANHDGHAPEEHEARPSLLALYGWLNSLGDSIYPGAPVVAQFNHLPLGSDNFNHFARAPQFPNLDNVITLAELAVCGNYMPARAQDVLNYLVSAGVLPVSVTLAQMIIQRLAPTDIGRGEALWRQALDAGWKLAPTLGADNFDVLDSINRAWHTGIYLLPGDDASPASVLRALAQRRTFASQDRDAKLQLWCGDTFMGDPLPATPPFELTVKYSDLRNSPIGDPAQPPNVESVELVLAGQPDPLRLDVTAALVDGKGFYYWDVSLTGLPSPPSYVYARVQRDAEHRLFSAPLWF